MVRGSLDQILAGTFEIPSYEEMISILQRDFEHTFDEFMARRKIMKSHIAAGPGNKLMMSWKSKRFAMKMSSG